MKISRNILIAIAIVLSDIMCAVVAFNYANMLCGIEHSGFSAPASTAYYLAIPYAIGIAICVIIAIILEMRIRKKGDK